MGNFFPVGKVGANVTYADKGTCEAAEGQACYDITGKDLRYHSLQNVGLLDVEGNPLLNDQQLPITEIQLVEDPQLKIAVLAADQVVASYEQALALRMGKFNKALRVIALMGHLNEQKSLTQAQVESFLATYQPIMSMLLSMSIPTARAMVAALTPDGVITTQADKDAVLAEIDA